MSAPEKALRPSLEAIREAFRSGDRTSWSTLDGYEAFWDRVDLPEGAPVVVAVPNSVALLGHFFGVLRAGGVPALMSPSIPNDRAKRCLEALNAGALVALAARPLDTDPRDAFEGGDNAIQVFDCDPPVWGEPGRAILTTSGTSGFSSGCLFEMEALRRNARRHASEVGLRSDDTVLVTLPLYFSYAFVAQAIACFERGASLVLDRSPFNPAQYERTIEDHGVTVSSLTPKLVRRILDSDAAPGEGLRALTVGGDQIEAGRVAALQERMSNTDIYLTYGLTEAGPRVATLAVDEHPLEKWSSVGTPVPGTQVRIDGADEPGETGELLVRSDTLMTRRVGIVEGRSEEIRDDGWLETGDLFKRDEDGLLHFVGRTSDFVTVMDRKVSLASATRIVESVSGVLNARADRLEDDEARGYRLEAVVEEVTEEQRKRIEEAVEEELRPYERPACVDLTRRPRPEKPLYK